MIATHGLTKRYEKTLAVDDLTFTVPAGVVTGFLGPNGSGKSTTMRMIMGLDLPDAGSATVNGSPYAALRWPLRDVGSLLDGKAFHDGGTPQPPALAGSDERHPRRRVDEVLDLVGLTSVANRPPASSRSEWASAWLWRARSWATPVFCCSTNQSTGSTPRASAGSATCSRPRRPRPHRACFESPHQRDGAHRPAARRHRPWKPDCRDQRRRVHCPVRPGRHGPHCHSDSAAIGPGAVRSRVRPTVDDDGAIMAHGMRAADIGEPRPCTAVTVHELTPRVHHRGRLHGADGFLGRLPLWWRPAGAR